MSTLDRAILPRAMSKRIREALDLFPVVVVTGARQTGKSTLVRHAADFSHRRYLTLDTTLNRELAKAEPHVLLGRDPNDRLTLDEVQREPQLLLPIKEQIDEHRRNGRFLLTGSANLLLLNKVTESLAGRARYLTLWPLTRREQLSLASCGIWDGLFSEPFAQWLDVVSSQTATHESWRALAMRGGYPAPALLQGPQANEQRQELFAGYVQTYLERDVRELAAIDSLIDFRRLMRAVCLRIGAVLNQTELARDTGIARTTVQRYLNLLEISYQLISIEPYAVNRTKRLVKSPRIYWSDTGLAMHLASQVEPTGAHLENIVINDLLVWREMSSTKPDILWWRTSTGEEVDFVIEYQNRLIGIEVKATTSPGYNDAKNLRLFRQEYGDKVHGCLLLHGGDKTQTIAEGVLAAPWWKVL
jgi:uncharacterized protein